MSLDTRILLAVNQGWAHPWLDAVFTQLSATWGFSFPVLALLAALLLRRFGRDGLWLSMALAAVILCGDALGNLVKHLLTLPRPCLELAAQVRPPGPCGGGNLGMPSNHALNFFAAAAFLAPFLRRGWSRLALFLLAAAVGLSRIYLARHYPSQVLAGASIGLAVGFAGAWIAARTAFGRRVREHGLPAAP
ncbi:MAG: phosphatase PAP2 family protein [Myxococcales bacterium]|jgi:undecaprenyl-diphosphatase